MTRSSPLLLLLLQRILVCLHDMNIARSADTLAAPSVSSLIRSPFPPRSPMRGAASASAFSPVGAASPKSAARKQGGGTKAGSPDSGRAAASLEPRVLVWGRGEAAAEEATGGDTASVPVRVASPPAAFDAGVFVCPEGAASAEEQAAVLPVVPPLSEQAAKSEAAPSRSDVAADAAPAVVQEQVVLADLEGVGAAGRLGADDWLMNSARQRVLVNQQLDRTLSTVAAAPSSQPKSFIQVRLCMSHHHLFPSLTSASPPSLLLPSASYPKQCPARSNPPKSYPRQPAPDPPLSFLTPASSCLRSFRVHLKPQTRYFECQMRLGHTASPSPHICNLDLRKLTVFVFCRRAAQGVQSCTWR